MQEPTQGAEGAAVFPLIPPELGVDPLLLVVIHATVFLDGSEADMVNADAAGEVLEYFASYLQRLSGPRLLKVREDLDVLAAYSRDQKWSKQQVRFLKEFLADFGIPTNV